MNQHISGGGQSWQLGWRSAFAVIALGLSIAMAGRVDGAESSSSSKKFRDFKQVTKDAKQHDGLFRLYHVDDHLYAELRPNHFREMYLAPITIAKGMASAGTPLNFGDEWILSFRKVGDRVQLIRKNVHYEAPKDTPIGRAVDQNYTDSVLMALPIVSINPSNRGVLIDFSSIFISDFPQLGIGRIDRARSSWHKIKTFEKNVELEVEATYTSTRPSYGESGVIDPRGVTVIVHYSLAKRPGSGYKPRYADQRVGHFISATKDFSKDTRSNFVRRINRWRLEKANPSSKLSPPKKQITWWVENTVPHEYRPYVEDAILEWNKAFEKIGYRNALGVRWQNERDEFDPEDINYCTFRWITTPSTFAMSGLRADPITGEMIDGDVIFDASWIQAWKDEYALMVGAPAPSGLDGEMTLGPVMDVAEVISPIMAAKHGYGVPMPSRQRRAILMQHSLMQHDARIHNHQQQPPMLVPAERSPLNILLSQRAAGNKFSACNCASTRRHEYALAAIALASRNAAEEEDDRDESDQDEDDDEKDDEQDEEDDDEEKEKESKKPEELKLPEELIGQAIKEVVMHEVGHSLGLRHNFKASSMLSLEELNDPEVTREKGMTGSVMDYNPLNIVRKGKQQGQYAMTTIGPYDYWAIEYAYSDIRGDEKKKLAKIAARSPEPDLVYATDEDLYLSNDPLVNTYDLGDDNLAYAKDRIALAKDLLKELDETVVRDGESWYRLRRAFMTLLNQYGNGAYLGSAYIGGEYFSRDFKGTEGARDPVVPVDGEKQRAAIRFLVDDIFQDEAYEFSPELLRRLTTEHWYHWGSDSLSAGRSPGVDLYRYILRVQQIGLNHCLQPGVLRRLQNHETMAKQETQPLTVGEVFRTLTDGIWSELKATGSIDVSTIRRNLQRDYVQRLTQIVIGPAARSSLYSYAISITSSEYPADARSLARMHLTELHKRLDTALGNAQLDDVTRAHFQDMHSSIGKALESVVVGGR